MMSENSARGRPRSTIKAENCMDKYIVEILATVMLDGCVSTPQVMYADLSAPGRYDKVWGAAIRAAAKMRFTVTTENRSTGQLVFDQPASPPHKENYWIHVSFSEVAPGGDTEIMINCGRQTKDKGIFSSFIDPISRDHCQQMQGAIIKALVE